MYCSKCGKQTQNQNGICDQCAAEAAVTAQPNNSAGRGKAITSLVLSQVASVLFMVFFLAAGFMGSIIGLIIALPMWIVAMIFGVQSIKTFKRVKSAGEGKPVITLVFGIIGLALSAIYLFSFVFGLMIGFIGAML